MSEPSRWRFQMSYRGKVDHKLLGVPCYWRVNAKCCLFSSRGLKSEMSGKRGGTSQKLYNHQEKESIWQGEEEWLEKPRSTVNTFKFCHPLLTRVEPCTSVQQPSECLEAELTALLPWLLFLWHFAITLSNTGAAFSSSGVLNKAVFHCERSRCYTYQKWFS